MPGSPTHPPRENSLSSFIYIKKACAIHMETCLRGCLGKILQKFDFLLKLGFQSPYLVNHSNEFHLMKKSN